MSNHTEQVAEGLAREVAEASGFDFDGMSGFMRLAMSQQAQDFLDCPRPPLAAFPPHLRKEQS